MRGDQAGDRNQGRHFHGVRSTIELISMFRCRWRWLVCLSIAIYTLLLVFAVFNKSSRLIYNMPEIMAANISTHCRPPVDQFGLVSVNLYDETLTIEKLQEKYSAVESGAWHPVNCTSLQRVAVIVPYRARYKHFLVLLNRLHELLQKQLLDYQILAIEQSEAQPFNRGRLLNIGVLEALKLSPRQCMILHDVDLLPEHDGNLYMCDGDRVRHLASAINEMRYHVLYYNYLGGVTAVSTDTFLKANGFPNQYWGWGNEDDDFSARTQAIGVQISRPPEHIGRYKMVRHVKEWRSNNGYSLLLGWRSRWQDDGVSNVTYSVLDVSRQALFIKITVDIGQPQPVPMTGPRETLWWFLEFFFP